MKNEKLKAGNGSLSKGAHPRTWGFWLVATLLFAFSNMFATTLISPSVNNGGFESGSSVWTFVAGEGLNSWTTGAASTPFAGSSAAYVSNDGGTTYAYDNTSISTSHFYQDVAIPSGETDIALSFQLKCVGETGWDRLLVYAAPTSVTPVAGTPTLNATAISGATLIYTQTAGFISYGVVNVVVPGSFAGTTMRLIFTWVGDDSFGSNPPASVDDVTLTSLAGPLTYYSKAAATNFSSVASWGSNADGSGSSPASITNTDSYEIRNGSAMTLNSSVSVRNLAITNGSLTISANTLTVAIPSVNNALCNVQTGGTLTVSGGTLDVNGRLLVQGTGALAQSGGNINVDGNNAGIAASSVGSGLGIVTFTSSNLNLTGGTLTIVDPHANTTASVAFDYNAAAAYNSGIGHTFRFGNGVSTDPGGNATNGFRHSTWTGAGRFLFGNLTVHALAGTNRFIASNWSHGIAGNVTVTSGELRTTSTPFAVAGNISVAFAGTLTANSTVVFANYFGGTTTASTVAQTVSGTGVFRNSNTIPTACFTSVTINNSNAAGVTFSGNALSGTGNGTVSGTLTFTTGILNTVTNPFVVGVSTTTVGTLTFTNGGFGTGSSYRKWFGTTTMTTGATPVTLFAPFIVNGQNRRVNMNKSANWTTGGWIQATHTDAAGLVANPFTDAGYSVSRRTNASWSFTSGGGINLGATTLAMGLAIEGPIVTAAAPGTAPRLIQVGAAAGTHVAGTGTTAAPIANRSGLSLAQLTGSSHYVGINTGDLGLYSIASGAWESGATWSSGSAPTAVQSPLVSNGNTVTINGAAAAALAVTVNGTLNVTGNTLDVTGAASSGITIGAAGDLNISGGTVNVGPQDNSFCNRTVAANGILSVSGGAINIAGNLALNSGGTLTQSAGNITVDGNAAGSAANSVASGTNIVQLNPSSVGGLNLTGGTLTVVDPHANTTASGAFHYNGTVNTAIGLSHNLRFGNGVSTDAGGNATAGFRIEPYQGGARVLLGNVTLDLGAGTNRYLTGQFTGQVIQVNNLTINAGSEWRHPVLSVAGNLVNNGILTTTTSLAFAYSTLSTGTYASAPSAQSIGGSGVFRNSLTPTGEVVALRLENSSVGGVTLNVPITATGQLAMVTGKLNTTSTNILTHASTTSNNFTFGAVSLGYVNGPMRATIPTFTNFTTWFPVGKTQANYCPFFNVVTTGPVTIQVETNNTVGSPSTFDGSLVSLNSGREWVTSIVSGLANLTSFSVQAFDANMINGNALAKIKSPATDFSVLGTGSTWGAAAGAFPPFLALNVPPVNAIDFPDRIGFGQTGPLDVSNPTAAHTDVTQVAANTTNNRILRIIVPALGSTGAINLTDLTFTYSGSNVADIATNGVKLWRGSFTAPTTQIGTGLSLAGGQAIFSGITGQAITSGNNYFWITLDVAASATIGNNIDGFINAGDMLFSTSGGATVAPTLPALSQNPVGNRLIDYCVTSYANGCAGGGDGINNVSLGTLSNASGCPLAPYYTFFNAITIPDLELGISYPISISLGSDANQYSRVWVDFNKNGVFETSESFSAGTNAGGNGTSTFNIDVPPGATLGNTRMRVRGGEDVAILNTQACGASSNGYGETEDYIVNITSPTPKSITSITATQQTGGIAINSGNNNLLRVNIAVAGSAGTLTLNSIQFNYTGTSASDIAALGATLWSGNATTPSAQIGPGVSISAGLMTFSSLATVLSAGTNYFWLRVNSSAGAVIPNVVDASISAGDVSITESGGAVAPGTQPAALVNPAGNRFIDYCATTYSSGCGTGADGMNNVVLNGNSINLANASGCPGAPYYTFFNAVNKPDLFQGATYPISITFGSDGNQYSRVWIDFDNDGAFEASESFSLGTNAGSNGTSIFNIVVPVTATLGDVRMRVRGGEDAAVTDVQACGASNAWGETEDYIVTIIAPPNCTTLLPFPATAATASALNVCTGTSINFGITVPMPNGTGTTYQWRRNGINIGSPVSSSITPIVVTASGNYDVQVRCNGITQITSAPIAIIVNSPTVTPGTNPTRCGTGTANLTATIGGGASQVRWYDQPTGGAQIGTGSPFTTPSISATTTYYVAAASVGTTVNGGKTIPTETGTSSGGNDWGIVFDAPDGFTLNSVDVFPNTTTGGTMTLEVRNSLGVLVPGLTGTYAYPAVGSLGTAHTIALNYQIPPGSGYRLVLNAAMSGGGCIRDFGGSAFPYTLGTSGTITGGYIGGASGVYYFFYNFSVTPSCVSARQPMTVTVTTPPVLTLSSASQTICNGASTPSISLAGQAAYSTFSWSPSANVTPNNAAGPYVFNPSASGVYTLTATSGAGCVNVKTIAINVNPTPTTGTATFTTNPICEGSALALNASGFTSAPVPLLTQDFESGIGAWSINAASVGGTLPGVANWNIQPHGYSLDARVWNSPGGNNFIVSDADAAGSGVTINTQLTSPTFSTVGAASATVAFRHHVLITGTRVIQGSTDGGATWPISIATFNAATVGSLTAFNAESIALPAGMLDQANAKIRFSHTGGWDWAWGIDDIVISAASLNYAWTGPNAYTNATQNPSIAGATPTNNGVYNVVVTNLANCTATASTAAAVVNPTPVASVSGFAPHTIASTNCQVVVGTSKSPANTIYEATATGGTISWAHNGAGSISAGNTTATPTYTPAAGDAGNTVTLTMTVTPPAPCTPVTATYTIQFRSAPTITIDDANQICTTGNPFRVLSVSSAINPAMEYTWPANDLYLDPSFTIPYIAGTNATTVYSVPFGTQVYAVTERDPITNCAVSSTPITITVCAALTQSICDADANPTVAVGTSSLFTQYNLVGSSASALNTGVACGMPIVDLVRDAFYKVVVPASGEIHVTTAPGTNANPLLRVQRSFIQILVGANCNTTAIQGCDRAGAAGLHSYAYATGLTPGQTAYVRIASVADVYTSPTAGATNIGTTVTVSSTTGLSVGMTVTVVGGTGAFPVGTTVSNIISSTQFEVTQVPGGFSATTVIKGRRANPEQVSIGMNITDALVWSGAGNTDFFDATNWAGGDATAITVPGGNKSVRITKNTSTTPQPLLVNNYTSAAGASSVTTTVTVASTAGLRVGMVVRVASGGGSFTAGTTVTAVTSATTFTVNIPPIGLGGTSVISGSPAVRNLILGTNSEVQVGATSSFGIYNNITANNNIIYGAGFTNLIGITEQQFNGAVQIYNLAINNPAGARVNSPVRFGSVRLQNGALTTLNNVTLLSDPAKTGDIDNFSAGYTGTVVGQVNVERRVVASANANHFMSSPVTTTQTVAQNYNDDFSVVGTPSNYVYSSNPNTAQPSVFPNTWTWDETLTDPFTPGYINALGTVLAPGQGFNANVSGVRTLDIRGPINTGNISRAVTLTDNGFNLVGNPYPSSLRFNNLVSANSSLILPILYVWNPAISNYATYNGSVWNNNPAGSGASDAIGHSQGMFVIATASGNLNFTNSMRTTTNPGTFFSTPAGVIKLQVSSNGYSDETTLMTQSNASENYDQMVDAKKLLDGLTPAIQLFTVSADNTPLAINAMDKFNTEQIIPLQVIAQTAGEINIKLAVEELSGVYEDIYLEDATSGTFTDLKAKGSYKALVGQGNSGSRFFLHFAKPTTTTAVATELNVYSANNTVFVNLPSESNGTIEVVDMAGKTIYTSNFNGKSGRVSFTVPNAVVGNYLVKLTSNGKVVSQKVMLSE